MQTHDFEMSHRRGEPLEDPRSAWYFGAQGSALRCVTGSTFLALTERRLPSGHMKTYYLVYYGCNEGI